MDRSKARGTHPLGWRMSQALVKTFSLMVLSLVFVLAWESRRPLNLNFKTPETAIIQLHLGDFAIGEPEKTRALWASVEHLASSDVRLRDRRPAGKVEILEAIVDDSVDDAQEVSSLISHLGDHDSEKQIESWSGAAETGPKNFSDPASRLESEHVSKVGGEIAEDTASFDPFVRKLAVDLKEEVIAAGSKDDGAEALIAQVVEDPLITSVPSPVDETRNNVSSTSELCDFSRGSWVVDENHGFYSGLECQKYLSRPWACRELNRPEFEYEKFRWQPDGCELPSFTGERFLQRMKNQVLAFVGDSLGRQQFQSLMCMITSGKDHMEVEDITKAWGAHVGWAYRFPKTNTTVLFSWSSSLCEIEPGNPNEKDGYSAMHLDRPAAFLRDNLDKLDVVILNTGHHWNRGKLQSNKWHPYVNGKPLANRKLSGMGAAMNFTVFKVVQWLDGQLAQVGAEHPVVYLRTLSPRHFKNGEWDSGGSCDSTRPQLSKVRTVVRSPYNGPTLERVAENAVKGTRVKLLDITFLSQSREEGTSPGMAEAKIPRIKIVCTGVSWRTGCVE